jgi:hypothetical protein
MGGVLGRERLAACSALVDGQEVIANGEAEQGEGSRVDLAAAPLGTVGRVPAPVLLLFREQGLFGEAACGIGVVATALVHPLGVVIDPVIEPRIAWRGGMVEEIIGPAGHLMCIVVPANLEGENPGGGGGCLALAALCLVGEGGLRGGGIGTVVSPVAAFHISHGIIDGGSWHLDPCVVGGAQRHEMPDRH